MRLCCAQAKVAGTNRVKRLIHNRGFVYHSDTSLTHPMLCFLYLYRIRVSSIMFESNFSQTAQVQLTGYLRNFGQSVKYIKFTGSQQEITLASVAKYCKNIINLQAFRLALNSTFAGILWQNPNLQYISLDDVVCVDSCALNGLRLNKLTELDLDNCSCEGNLPWLQNVSSDSLLCVDFFGSNLHTRDLLAVLKNCPQIKALGVNGIQLSDDILRQVVEIRPTIMHLDVGENEQLTDNGIRYIALKLFKLYFFDCQGCTQLTDTSLSYLVENHGSSLSVLYADLDEPDPIDAIQSTQLRSFCQRASALHTFCASTEDFNNTNIACCLVTCCPALHTLIATDGNRIDAGVRAFLHHLSPKLRIQDGDDVDFPCVSDMPM